MKTKLFNLTALLMVASFGIFGQTTLLSESFETDGNGSRYTSNQAGACNDFFDRVNATPGCFSESISGADNNWYMASEDVFDRPGGGEGIVTFNSINTTGYINLSVSLKAATSDGSTASWEVNDHVFVEYAFDGNIGSSYTIAGLFQGNPPSGNNSGYLTVDTDNNPNTAGPYGTQVSATGVLNNFTFSIPATGNSLSIRVRIAQDGGTEEFAYDLVEVKGTLAVNDPPVLANIEGSNISYTEGDPATQVTNTMTVADSENDPISSATVEISSGFASGEDVLTFTAQGGVSGSQTGNTLSLTGSASTTVYQNVLRSVKYQNTNNTNPSTATRAIRFRVNDGGNSNDQTRNISITPTVNAPVALPVCESFETDGEGTRYTSNTYMSGCDFFMRTNTQPTCHLNAISGADGSYYWASEDVRSGNGNVPAVLTLSPLIATGASQFTIDVLLGVGRGLKYETTDAILVQYNFDGASWTTVGAFYGDANPDGDMRQDADLNGSADPAGTVLTTALQNFQFAFAGTGTNLNVRVVVDQTGGNEEIIFDKVCVTGSTPVNLAPVLANIEGTDITYVEGSGAQQVSNTITVSDPEADLISGASISVFQGFDATEDMLTFSPNFGVLGNFVGNTLTLTGSATAAQYQTLLRSVTYTNTDGTDPSLQNRTIQFVVTDGNISNAETRNIVIDASLNAAVSLPACESFETDGHGARYQAYEHRNGNDFWERHLNTSIPTGHTNAITGADGNYIWVGEDVENSANPNPNNIGEMLLQPFAAGLGTVFSLDIDLAVGRLTPFETTGDYFIVQYKMDAGSWITILAFYGNAAGNLQEDTDLNGIPDGTSLTTALTTYTKVFSASGTNLQVRIQHESEGNEEIGFDKICVSDVSPPAPCNISSIAIGTQSPCAASLYSQDIVVTYTNAPSSGTLDLNGQSFAITGSPQTVTLTGLVADGNPVNVTAAFSADAACTKTETAFFTAPTACPNSYMVVLNPSKDNTIYEEDQANGNGAGPAMISGKNAVGLSLRAMLAFDVSTIPSGATINQVSLKMNQNHSSNSNGSQVVNLHKLTQDWVEGTEATGLVSSGGGLGVPTTNGSNWTKSNVTTNTLWTSPGGDFNTTASASQTVGGNGFYSWSSASMTTDVQDWLNNSVNNAGWLIKGNETGFATAKRFNTKEAGSALAPELTVYYTYVPPCNISSVGVGPQSPCVNNLYSQEVTVTYSNDPGSGTLDVNGQSFSITASPQTVTLTGLVADGNPVNVTAVFSADAACTKTETALFTAPAACPPPSCSISSITVGTQTPCVNNQYSQEVTVTYSNAPATGSLDVNGHTFTITGSPQTETLTGLPTTGSPVNLIASFTADPQCSFTSNSAFVAPGPCVPATGLDFDGSDDRVQLGPISIVGSISIEAWVKPSSKSNFLTILSTKNAGSFNPGFLFAINEFNSSNGKLVFETNDAAVFSNASVTWDVWQHVAFTYDGTTAKMYINGVDVGVTLWTGFGGNNISGVNLQASSAPAYIGHIAAFSPFNGNFLGSMDEVRVWSVGKSATEIAANKDCALAGNETGLVAYYDFDNGFAGGNNAGLTTLTDESSNTNDGTLQNFALSGPTSNWVEGANISGTCVSCTNPVTASIQAYGLKSFWGAPDPNTFYFGVSQWKRLFVNTAGGIGPYTYTWSVSGPGQLKGQSGNSIYLFDPTGPVTVTVTVDDLGTGCQTTEDINIAWDDQYFCGTVAPRTWYLKVCDNGISSCVPWGTAKAMIQNGAVLGDCNAVPKTNISSTAFSTLYPNPTQGQATFEFNSEQVSEGSLVVLDINGRVISQRDLTVGQGLQAETIDLTGLPNGMYIIRLHTEHQVFTERLQLLR